MGYQYSRSHSKEYKDELAKNHEVIVISDLLNAPQDVRDFYRKLKDACTNAGKKTFLPLDFLRLEELMGLDKRYNEAKELTFEITRNSELVVAYLGYQGGNLRLTPRESSLDLGKMLGETKLREKPTIFVYEAEKADYLRKKDPKIWWQPKSKDAIRRMRTQRRKMQRGPMIVTPTSEDSFLIPNSRDPHIIKEIVFDTREQALSELEAYVKNF